MFSIFLLDERKELIEAIPQRAIVDDRLMSMDACIKPVIEPAVLINL